MIRKRTINLLLQKKTAQESYKRYNKLAVSIAIGAVSVFLLFYIASFLYLQINIGKYERMKKEISLREKNISDRSSVEGLSMIAHRHVDVIKKLLDRKKNYPKLLSHLLGLQSGEVTFSSISISQDNLVTIAMRADSSTALQEYVNQLLSLPEGEKYSHILAQGILRDRYGKYSLTITMYPQPLLLK